MNGYPSLRVVAAGLGMTEKSKRWSPCPMCGEKESRKQHQFPLLLNEDTWHCVLCKNGGDALALVAAQDYGLLYPKGRMYYAAVDRVYALAGETPPPSRPTSAEVERPAPRRIDPTPALGCAVPLHLAQSSRLAYWLESRAIPPTAPGFWLERFTAPWWPNARAFPVVIPAYDGRGHLQSLHGLAVDDEAPRKTTWPKGAEARELLFADDKAVAWMQGKGPEPGRLLVAEGGTDYLSAAARAAPDTYVLAVCSGSARALALLPSLQSATVVVATDNDETGDRYAREVAQALQPYPVHRWKAA